MMYVRYKEWQSGSMKTSVTSSLSEGSLLTEVSTGKKRDYFPTCRYLPAGYRDYFEFRAMYMQYYTIAV